MAIAKRVGYGKKIIVGVNKNSLCVIDSENNELLYEVYFSDEGNIGFLIKKILIDCYQN